ncbi:MAG: hypothetical protein Q9187_006224 [Circinaria calcarea]
MVAEAEVAAAGAFLAPVLNQGATVKSRGRSLVECLAAGKHVQAEDNTNPRSGVIHRALGLLLNIHHVLCNSPTDDDTRDFLYNSSYRRIVDSLFDLISLEGIYPNLSSGVGVPIERRVKSVLRGGFETRTTAPREKAGDGDEALLVEIVNQLRGVAESKGRGLGRVFQERTLVDLIAALGQLAYAPSSRDSKTYQNALKSLIDEAPSLVLFPCLTSLLHSATPSWLRPYLSTALSSLPLRPNGVHETIVFIAGSSPQALYQDINGTTSPTAQSLPLEVLKQSSRLLSSVPSTISADLYFEAIAPQLLELLDAEGPDKRRAASFIIGNGILGRRIFGAPGAIGWKLFAEPLMRAIAPGNKTGNVESEQEDFRLLVSSEEFQRAIRRLSALVVIHPNPSLTKRLLGPLLLPLWGLMCFAKESEVAIGWFEECSQLISIYFKVSEGSTGFAKLIDHLTWDGGLSWTYKRFSEARIALCRRPEDYSPRVDAIALMETIDSRVTIFRQLLETSGVDDTDISDIFLHAARGWLQGSHKHSIRQDIFAGNGIKDGSPFKSLVYAKVTQEMLERYQNIIINNPARVIHLTQELLDGYLHDTNVSNLRAGLSIPSLATLGSIVTPELQRTPVSEVDDSAEIVSACISLLSTILSAPDIRVTPEILDLLTSLRSTLTEITSTHASLPASTAISARNICALVEMHLSSTGGPRAYTSKPPDPHVQDRKTYSRALTHLSDILPPVRAEGLALLTTLITASSAILDIPGTCILILSLLQDQEEFIYLSAIKSLGLLASKHSRTAVRMLVENYVDHGEEMRLDQRLRVGEALLKTMEGLGEALVGDVARTVGEGMIGVAGRRGKRAKTLAEQQERAAKHLASKREAEDAWGGDVPDFGDDQEENHASERLAKVLEGWEGKEGEEDVRIRTSALSVLGLAIETNVAGMGSTLTSTAIDLAISILKMEVGPDKAILRRAAVLLIMSLIRALDKANDKGQKLGFGLAGESLKEVLEVLRYIKSTDSDDVVVGHVMEVIESLEAWRMRSLLSFSRSAPENMFPTSPVYGNLAGLSINSDSAPASRPRIEEVE